MTFILCVWPSTLFCALISLSLKASPRTPPQKKGILRRAKNGGSLSLSLSGTHSRDLWPHHNMWGGRDAWYLAAHKWIHAPPKFMNDAMKGNVDKKEAKFWLAQSHLFSLFPTTPEDWTSWGGLRKTVPTTRLHLLIPNLLLARWVKIIIHSVVDVNRLSPTAWIQMNMEKLMWMIMSEARGEFQRKEMFSTLTYAGNPNKKVIHCQDSWNNLLWSRFNIPSPPYCYKQGCRVSSGAYVPFVRNM